MNLRKTNNGYTALHQAAILGDVALVKMLIDKGADTELCDNEQMTPLHRSVGIDTLEYNPMSDAL